MGGWVGGWKRRETYGAELALVPAGGDGAGLNDADDEEEGGPEQGVDILDLLL